MARDKKYAAGCTVGDVQVYCQQLLTWHDLQVEVELGRVGVNDLLIQCEVRLYEGVYYLTQAPPIVIKKAALSTRGEGQWSQLMLALQSAVADYEANPWSWTLRTRKREVATQVDSTPL